MFSARSCLIAAAVLFPCYITFAEAFWRLQCGYRSGLARLDPLINPGGVSDHVHAIHGGSGMSPFCDSSSPYTTSTVLRTIKVQLHAPFYTLFQNDTLI